MANKRTVALTKEQYRKLIPTIKNGIKTENMEIKLGINSIEYIAN